MLILHRRKGESIVVDEKIKVTVVKFSPSVVYLGFEGPREILIKRSELDE